LTSHSEETPFNLHAALDSILRLSGETPGGWFFAADRASINRVIRTSKSDFMDSILVVVFDKDIKAYEGECFCISIAKAASEFEATRGSKDDDEKATRRQDDDTGPFPFASSICVASQALL